jgi:cytochrome c2
MKKISLDRYLLALSAALALLALGVSVAPKAIHAFRASAVRAAGPQEAALPVENDAQEEIEVGRELFRNLGCVTCHVHKGVEGRSGVMRYGGFPDLTNYSGDPEFLRSWLADPKAVRLGTEMPNLRLTSEEIELLAAFLSAP